MRLNHLLFGFFPFFDAPGDMGGGDGSELSRDLADLEDIPDDTSRTGKGGKGAGKGADDEGNEDGEGEGDDNEDGNQDDEEEEDGEGDGSDDEEETDEEREERERLEAEGETDEEKADRLAKEKDNAGRPTVKAIKAKYPNLFKDFPELKAAYFTLPRYQEVFADPEEAVESAAKSVTYDQLEESLVTKSDPKFLLQMLEKNAPKQLKKMIGNFAGSLREVAPDSYTALTTPIIEELLYFASNHGIKVGNKNLEIAAKHIANFVFSNGGEIPDISKRSKAEPSQAEKDLELERANNAKEKFGAAAATVETTCAESLDRILTNKLDGLSKFEVRALTREARAEVNKVLNEDKALQSHLTSLWRKAQTDNYSPASKERIKEAWLSRARQVAPAIRNRLRQEALADRGSGDRNSDANPQRKRTFKASGGGSGKQAPRVLDPNKIDWSKTSDADILGDDTGRVKLRK